MKPKSTRERKERASDKDTVVAYHEFIQGRIQGELNGVTIGPGYMLSRIALAAFIFGGVNFLVGILVITLRHRHVYLVSWDAQFLGPFFIILGFLCCGFATFLLLLAKQRTNQYRADLAFRPIGDYGVAVVHKSKLNYDDQKKSELKSGTTPHNVRHPGRPGVNDRGNRGDYSNKRSGYDSRGYKDDTDRYRDRDPEKRRDYPDSRGRGDPNRPRRDDRHPRPEGEKPPRDGERRGPPRGPRPDGERRGPPRGPPRGPDGERRGPPRGPRPDGERRGPPRGPEDERRRAEDRRRYEEDKRRHQEEDRRRAALRKQAEADSQMDRPAGDERGVDVNEGTRTYQIQTKVTLSRELQETDESEL